MKAFIGIGFEDKRIIGVAYDIFEKRLAEEEVTLRGDEDKAGMEAALFGVLDRLTGGTSYEVQGIGVGVQGIISKTGDILYSSNAPLSSYPLGKVLEERYSVSVRIYNNVNCSVYGSYKYTKNGDNNVIGLFVGRGIGGAIIIGGDLYRGIGGAAEFGHTVVQPDGALCSCGNYGCLEAYASMPAVQRYIYMQSKKGRVSMLSEVAGRADRMSVEEVYNAYQVGDAVVCEAVDRMLRYLGIECGNLINIFHPDSVIIGGRLLERFGKMAVKRIESEAKTVVLAGGEGKVKIALSELGKYVCAYGAYQLAQKEDIACI